MNHLATESASAPVGHPAAEKTAYDALMRTKEAFRLEAQRLASELADAKAALRPFAALGDVCDHFNKKPDERILSWRIAGKRHSGPTAEDCREARRVYGLIIGHPAAEGALT